MVDASSCCPSITNQRITYYISTRKRQKDCLSINKITMDRDKHFCSCHPDNSCRKAKWKRRVLFNLRELTLISLIILPLFSLEVHGLSDFEICKRGEYLKGYALRGGRKAGIYKRIGYVDSFDDCVELCCWRANCEMALMLRDSCFQVNCYNRHSRYCKPVQARRSKYHPKLFRRGHNDSPVKIAHSRIEKKKSSFNNTDISDKDLPTLKRVKRVKPSCHVYKGVVCSPYMDHSKLHYYASTSDSAYEKSILNSFGFLKSSLTKTCADHALRAVCNQWYPECTNTGHPSPMKLCKDDCLNMKKTVCKSDYLTASEDKQFQDLLPDCSELSDESGDQCIPLSISDVNTTTSPQSGSEVKVLTHSKRKAESEPPSEEVASSSTPTSTPDRISTKFTSTTVSTPGPSVAQLRSTPTVPLTSHHSKSEKTKDESLGDIDQGASGQGNETESESPTIVKTTETGDGTKLAEEDLKTTVRPKAVVPTTSPVASIHVSAGDNKVITLPENKVSLYASAWPKPAKGVMYNYNWMQIEAPEKSHGYMEGKDLSRVTLSMLDVPGVYQFKVEVSSEHAKGVGFVNVTVKPVPRVNRPPRADIQPREQTVTLPVKSFVLYGSKSSDDDKIVRYKWEEVKGPISEDEKTVIIGADKAVLQVKNLVPGVYTFRLTVTDSDGEQDHTDATVTVKEEKDYPPVARAGDGAILTLPENQVTLYGNGSTDDKKIVKYEWTKSPDSPTVGDMQGTNKAILKVSNLVVGHYTFILHVTDAAGQTSESKVTVVVQPEKNAAPVAMAGPDKDLVYPDDSTTLDASGSTDDQHIVTFLWEKVSGPDGVILSDAKKAKLHLSKLVEGHYVFKVTVTDKKGLSASDTVAVNVKKDINEPPVAKAGPDIMVILPDRDAVLDGSKSTDDQLITSYEWSRDGKSPAAGDIINSSNHQSILRITNLVEGMYTFTLVVTDSKGLKGSDSAVVTVKQDENSLYLVELYLEVDIIQFTEESKKQLLRKLSVILNVDDGNVVVEELRRAAYGKGIMLVFYVMDPNLKKKLDGLVVANILKQKIGYHGTLFEYKMLKVEPYVCRNNCSGHGYCDRNTKQCVCDGFWMQDLFKASFGPRESNCDWSILYVTVIVFGIIVAVIGLTWAFCFLFSRRRKARRRMRYMPVHDDDDTKDEIMMIPKGKYLAHSLTFTESDDDSEEETTVFDKKVLVNGSSYVNGTANGLVPRKSHAT